MSVLQVGPRRTARIVHYAQHGVDAAMLKNANLAYEISQRCAKSLDRLVNFTIATRDTRPQNGLRHPTYPHPSPRHDERALAVPAALILSSPAAPGHHQETGMRSTFTAGASRAPLLPFVLPGCGGGQRYPAVRIAATVNNVCGVVIGMPQ